jgi:LemA protein
MEFLIVIGVLIVVLVLMYNFLIARKNHVQNLWGNIDAQLKKRYDLIPNLLASVQQYAKHERELLENITRLREQAIAAPAGDATVQANNALGQALSGLMVRLENYPDLKASDNFIHLQKTLSNTEQEISASRRSYNQAVTDYNNAIEMLPFNLIAGPMKLQRKSVFEIPASERENVDVREMFRQ